MVKGFSSPARTSGEALRDDLDRAESEITLLLRGRHALVPFLQRLDRIAQGLEALGREGADLRGEWTRWEAITAQLRAQPGRVWRHAAESPPELREACQAAASPPEGWWWALEELATQQRLVEAQRLSRKIAIVSAVVVILVTLLYLVFRPDPLTAAKLRHYRLAEAAIAEGNLPDAAQEYRAAAGVDAADPEPWLRLGWVLEQQGQAGDAAAAFAVAKEILGDEAAVALSLSRIYIEAGQPERGLEHALKATQLNPQSAEAFYILASAYEILGQRAEAISALTRSEELANAQGNQQLVGMIRVRMAGLAQLQAPMMPEIVPATP
ncbi:MAG: tetratricopeptide repeat protein [Chloroflexi bacterium]|nr:tetratricopeptide repeat protein [Chloroflexota bacterium]